MLGLIFPHILKQFWCWDCIFPSHLEAIRMLGLYISPISWSNSEFLVLGVFCCAPGPVVFRCNSLLSCYLSFWEASLGGLKQFWCLGCSVVPPGQLCSEVIVFVVLAFISPLMSNTGRFLFVLTSWSNSDVRSIFPPYHKQFWFWDCIFCYILKQFWCWECSAVSLGQLCADVTVFVGCGAINLSFEKQLWKGFFCPHILKQFWCWDCIFPPYLEAILMMGVFCCAPRPVVFRCNSLL